MTLGTPERLAHESYMSISSPFRLFKHLIDGHITVHWHEFFELALVESGTGTHVVNGATGEIGPGDLFLLTPADFHELIPRPGETLRMYNAIFVQQYLRLELVQWLFREGGGFALRLAEEPFRQCAAEFERIWNECENLREGTEWIVAGSLERILVDALRMLQRDGEGESAALAPYLHPSISRAVQYLQYHFRGPVTLETVARHAGLSANHFSECFRTQIGTPFQNYVQDMRLKFAHSLLGMTDLPVTEICYASGFGTLSHFGRSFKSKYGMTPRQARENPAPASIRS